MANPERQIIDYSVDPSGGIIVRYRKSQELMAREAHAAERALTPEGTEVSFPATDVLANAIQSSLDGLGRPRMREVRYRPKFIVSDVRVQERRDLILVTCKATGGKGQEVDITLRLVNVLDDQGRVRRLEFPSIDSGTIAVEVRPSFPGRPELVSRLERGLIPALINYLPKGTGPQGRLVSGNEIQFREGNAQFVYWHQPPTSLPEALVEGVAHADTLYSSRIFVDAQHYIEQMQPWYRDIFGKLKRLRRWKQVAIILLAGSVGLWWAVDKTKFMSRDKQTASEKGNTPADTGTSTESDEENQPPEAVPQDEQVKKEKVEAPAEKLNPAEQKKLESFATFWNGYVNDSKQLVGMGVGLSDEGKTHFQKLLKHLTGEDTSTLKEGDLLVNLGKALKDPQNLVKLRGTLKGSSDTGFTIILK